MYFNTLGYAPIRLTFAVHFGSIQTVTCRSVPERRRSPAMRLAMPRAHINTTIQLSSSMINLLLVTLAGYCEGFKYELSHVTLLSFTL